jgi:hypothetical protein
LIAMVYLQCIPVGFICRDRDLESKRLLVLRVELQRR